MKDSTRFGLRVLGVYVLLFIAVWIVNIIFGVGVNWILKRSTESPNVLTFVGSTINFGCRLIIIVALSAIALRYTLGINPWQAMFPLQSGWWKDLLFGMFLGAAVMFAIFAVELTAGWLTVEAYAWQEHSTDLWIRSLWMALLTNIFVAVTEETIYRGYLLTGLNWAWGRVIGLVVMAVLFSLPHLLVSDAGQTNIILFTLLLMVPGIVLGIAYLRSGALWLPIGIHFAWNFFQDEVINLTSDSANVIAAITKQDGPEWIVGTEYGVELGILGILGMGVVLAGAWLWTTNRTVTNPAFSNNAARHTTE